MAGNDSKATNNELSQERLRAFRQILENGIESVIVTNSRLEPPGPIIEYVNPAFEYMTGYAADEVIGKSPRILQGPRTDPAVLKRLRDTLAKGKIFVGETFNYDKHGREFLLRWRVVPLFGEDGRITHFIAVQRNVSEIQNIETHLRRLTSVIEHSEDGIVTVDMECRILGWSPAAERILGYASSDVLGRHASELVPQSTHANCARMMGRLRAGKRLVDRRVQAAAKDGRLIDIASTVSPIIDVNDQIIGASLIVRDVTEQSEIQRALQQEKNFVSAVLSASVSAVTTVDPSGRIVFANPKAREIFGIEPESVQGRTYNDPQWEIEGVDGKPFPEEQLPFNMVMRTKQPVNGIEHAIRRPDGETRILRISGAPHMNHRGEVEWCVFSAQDVTEQHKVNRELRESRNRLRAILDAASDAIIAIDERGAIESFNKTAEEMFGYRAHEVIGQNIKLLMPPPHREQHDQYLNNYLTTGIAQIIGRVRRLEARRKSGDTFPIELSVSEMRIDDERMFTGIIRDISGRIEVERERERLISVLEATSDFVGVVTSELQCIYINSAGRRMVGIGIDEDITQFNANDFHPEDMYEHVATVALPHAMEVGVWTGETRFLTRDGIEIPTLQTIVAHYEQDGERLAYFSTIARDISDIKAAEAERLAVEAQMLQTQKLESLGVLAGGIAHDFNNLLLGVIGNADLALTELPSTSPGRSYIENVVTSAQRAAELCRQLLAYSGRGKFVVKAVDLTEVVHEMSHMLEVTVSKKAAIRYDFAENLPAIEVDVTQLRQIIMNLIMNASDALKDQNGVISIRTGVTDCDNHYLEQSSWNDDLPAGRYVYLEVSDTGCGMDPETRDRIFEPFFSSKAPGRGLGLSAVLGIVRSHQGAIRVYSEPGSGTTIKVLLPACDQPPETLSQRMERQSAYRGAGTVLVVDDEPAVRRLATAILQKAGYTVITAHDGQEAVETFQAAKDDIDLVILDMTMPRLSGEETYRRMRQVKPNVCVVLSSGYTEHEATGRFLGKGLAGFLQKPYRAEELLQLVQRVLNNV